MITIKAGEDSSKLGTLKTPHTPGFYKARVIRWEEDVTKDTDKPGKPFLRALLEVEDAEKPRDMYAKFYSTDSGRWYNLERFCAACGLSFAPGDVIPYDKAAGRTLVVATAKQQADNGKLYNVFPAFIRTGQEPYLGAYNEEDAAFYHNKVNKKKEGAPAAPEAPATPEDDEEIPF